MRWHPSTTFTRQEQFLMKRLTRTRKLFSFLREHRHELFDDAFQGELESMYRGTGAGKEPVPPAVLAMVVLLQGYHGISDAEAVEMSVVDLRKLIATPIGRERLRERVAVEHRLAHLGRKQGRRARYLGVRKNLFDVRRAACVVNLETIHRVVAKAA
jgi:hypothetical protein